MAELCEVAGGDVTQLADAIGLDDRIGRRFLNAGLGFGGGCLPKDIRAFLARAEELHAEPAVGFLREIDSINLRRRDRMVDLTQEVLQGHPLAGARTVAPSLQFADTPEEAAEGADALLLLTEWRQYRDLDPDKLAERVRHCRILDGRNVLDPGIWRRAGWTYRALGRP
jgi:UDPglucose 6-dehydrogenase